MKGETIVHIRMLIFPDLYIDIHITYAMRMSNGIARINS